MTDFHTIIVGGGMAGVSAGALIAQEASVCVLEAEKDAGYHATGRSAAVLQEGLPDSYGGDTLRGLTAISRDFFEAPPTEGDAPALVSSLPYLQFGRVGRGGAVRTLYEEVAGHAEVELLDAEETVAACPLLRPGAVEAGLLETSSLSIDVDAVLQLFTRMLLDRGGELRTNARVQAIERTSGEWHVTTKDGAVRTAEVLVDAAGAWADQVAGLAGVASLGLRPLLRSAFTVASPLGSDTKELPMIADIDESFYVEPEGDALLCSPADEIPSKPRNAKPDTYEIARALDDMYSLTTVTARHVGSTWAGLRTFASDRIPVVGFDPATPGFFWLAGQGGCGIMTAPAMSVIAAELVAGRPMPHDYEQAGVSAAELAPERLS